MEQDKVKCKRCGGIGITLNEDNRLYTCGRCRGSGDLDWLENITGVSKTKSWSCEPKKIYKIIFKEDPPEDSVNEIFRLIQIELIRRNVLPKKNREPITEINWKGPKVSWFKKLLKKVLFWFRRRK